MSYDKALDYGSLDYDRRYHAAFDQALEDLPGFLNEQLNGEQFARDFAEEIARLYQLANDPKTKPGLRQLLPGRLISMIDIALDHHADKEACQ